MARLSSRDRVVCELLERFRRVLPGRRALIAIDGFDGAGKTHLATELVVMAERIPGRRLVGIGIDGFHRPRAERYANGRGATSFYRDSYQYAEFRERVVARLRDGRDPIGAIWDVDADTAVEPREVPVDSDGIVIVDGIFLHRTELLDCWDASLWLRVPFAISVARGNGRLPGNRGVDSDPEATSNSRYVGGQRLYLAEARPAEHATWILDNSDVQRPRLLER